MAALTREVLPRATWPSGPTPSNLKASRHLIKPLTAFRHGRLNDLLYQEQLLHTVLPQLMAKSQSQA